MLDFRAKLIKLVAKKLSVSKQVAQAKLQNWQNTLGGLISREPGAAKKPLSLNIEPELLKDKAIKLLAAAVLAEAEQAGQTQAELDEVMKVAEKNVIEALAQTITVHLEADSATD